MSLTDDEILKFQQGTPVFIDDICAVYSVKVREIIEIGYSKFQQYLGAITATKPESNQKEEPEYRQLIEQLTDFQYLLMTASLDKEFNSLLKQAFHFFIHDSVSFSLDPTQIIIGPLEEKHILNEEKFYELQSVIKRAYFLEQDGEDIIIYANDNEAVRNLKMKMRANREKVRKAKAKQAAKEKSDLKFSDLIGSITINNCGLNMENIWNITYYALQDQMKRMGWRDQFNINNQAALAGAKLKKHQLKHWMRSITSTDKS